MRDFLADIVAQGQLRRVAKPVDARFEMAAVTAASQRVSEDAILFERVSGSNLPVATNLYGSRARLCRLIGATDGAFCKRWSELMHKPPPAGEASWVEENLIDLKLSDLPPLTYFERDAGPYITAGIFLAREPETGVPNLSFHRCMMVNDTEVRVRLGSSHDLTKYQLKAEAAGQALEAAILIGAPPAVVMAAAAPIPYDESELDVAGKLGGRPLAMRRCRHIDLEVPAETEIVIEGRILPHVRRPEGPFGEFMGFYVPVGDNHVFEILGITARPNAVYHGLICGSPEDLRLLELAVATRIYQHVSSVLPGIVDVACVPTVMNTVIKIKKQYEGHGRQVLISAFGANHDWSKCVIVVDEDVDIGNFEDVWWSFLTRAKADSRIMHIPNVPGFYRDPQKDYWGRLGIDATKAWSREDEFERKSIPGQNAIDLKTYFG